MQYSGFLSASCENIPMTRNPKRIKRRRDGSLPFALVAVAIIIGASAYCAVAAGIRNADENADISETEMDGMAEAVPNVVGFIERGMGENVLRVSRDAGIGGMAQRSESFEKGMARWMDDMFPAEDSGIRVTVESYDMRLEVRDLRMPAGNYAANGYVPAFLLAEGTVEAVFESESGTAHRTLHVESDGSGSLPLSYDRGTMFENILGDGGSVLSQMVSYQLTCLAQYRVMNGYGAFAYYGEYGTDSVITESDVRDAYSRALRAAESIVFRDADGGLITGRADLAKAIVGSADGRMAVNVSAVYSQALAAVADQIVGKWFDYFLGNKILQICDQVDDKLRNAWDSFTSIITGRNSFSAEPYINEIVGDTDLAVGERMPFAVTLPDGGLLNLSLEYPEHDLMGSDTVSGFKSKYRDDTNAIRAWLYSIVNEAIAQAAETEVFGTVMVDLNDPREFSDILYDAVILAMEGAEDIFASHMAESLNWHSYPDQFYAAIYDAIAEDRENIFNTDYEKFKEKNAGTVFDAVFGHCMGLSGDEEYSRGFAEMASAEAFDLASNRGAFDAYVAEVDSLLTRMEALKNVQNSKSSIIERGCIGILRGGMLKADGAFDATKHLSQVCIQFSRNLNINATGRFAEMPDTDRFELSGNPGSVEKLNVKITSDPDITVGRPGPSRSTHQCGIEDAAGANYSTVFPVSLTDTVGYKVYGSGSVSDILRLTDSGFTGSSDVSMDLEIAVVSGWALADVGYETSTDVLHDLWKQLLKAAEPLMEPLRKALYLAGMAANALRESIEEFVRYAAHYVEELYEKIIAPLEELVKCIKEKANSIVGERIYEVANGMAALINITLKSQTIGFTYMGFTLKFTTDCASLSKTTKNLVKLEMSGNVGGDDISAYLDVKLREPRVLVTGGITIDGGDWKISGTVDPSMTQTGHLFTISGTFRGMNVDLALPEIVKYREIDVRISDLPGIGTALSNIPSPIAGTKISLDAGLNIKYSAPFEMGVIINEIESNPAGYDRDREWVEILNNTARTADVTDWVLVEGLRHLRLDEKLAPGERCVVPLTGGFLNNINGSLKLLNEYGTVVDMVGPFRDTSNDSKTYQRAFDGSTTWVLAEGSMGKANSAGMIGLDGILPKSVADIMKDAAKKAMGELKRVTDIGDVSELFTRTMQYALDEGMDKMSSYLVEASVFVSADIVDLTGSACTGFEVYVKAYKDMAEDLLKYVVGRMESMLLNIEDPYGVDLGTAASDGIYVGVTAYTGISVPDILRRPGSAHVDVRAGVDVACNASALQTIFGDAGDGTWNVRGGIVIRECPAAILPSGYKLEKGMNYDFWLMSVNISPS